MLCSWCERVIDSGLSQREIVDVQWWATSDDLHVPRGEHSLRWFCHDQHQRSVRSDVDHLHVTDGEQTSHGRCLS